MIDPVAGLTRLFATAIPIAAHMGIRVLAYDGRELLLGADLDANVNVHGTAFAGSLYSISTLVCWGLLHLKLAEAQHQASIVVAKGEITYRRPVCEPLRAACRLPAGALDDLERDLAAAGRFQVELSARVRAVAATGAIYRGIYVVRREGTGVR